MRPIGHRTGIHYVRFDFGHGKYYKAILAETSYHLRLSKKKMTRARDAHDYAIAFAARLTRLRSAVELSKQ